MFDYFLLNISFLKVLAESFFTFATIYKLQQLWHILTREHVNGSPSTHERRHIICSFFINEMIPRTEENL